MLDTLRRQMTGELEILVIENGCVVDRQVHRNTVVKDGYGNLLEAFIGGATGVASMAFGDSVTRTDFTDTAMPNLLISLSPFSLSVDRDALSFTVEARMLQPEGNGATYYDVALMCTDGSMFSRAVFLDLSGDPVGYDKHVKRELRVSWTIKFGTIGAVTGGGETGDGWIRLYYVASPYTTEPPTWPATWAWPPAPVAEAGWPDSWPWPPTLWIPLNMAPLPLTTWDPAGPAPPGWPADIPWPAVGPTPVDWPPEFTWPPSYWPPFDPS